MNRRGSWAIVEYRMYYLYMLKNSKTGKIYIGQTNNFDRRIAQHKRARGDTPLYRDIRKLGWKSFSVKMLRVAFSKKEINNLEKQEIEKRKTIHPSGYNMKKGGSGELPIRAFKDLYLEERNKIGNSRKYSKQIKRAKKRGLEKDTISKIFGI